jgi:hypothetical protein
VVWWIVAAAVVLPLVGLGAVLAGLRRRLSELARVAALGQERVAKLQPRLMASVARLQATLVELERRSAVMQQRLAAPPARRDDDR